MTKFDTLEQQYKAERAKTEARTEIVLADFLLGA